jgi:signal transduction histidine kinase
MSQRWKVPERLTLWAIGAAVALLVALLLGTTVLVSRYAAIKKEASLAESAAIAQGVAASIETRGEGHLRILQAYAPRFLFREAVARHDRAEAIRHLRQLHESFPEMDRLFVVDQGGVLWVNYPPAIQLHGVSFTDRDWFRAVIREPRPYVSEVYRSARDGALQVVYVVPVRSEAGQVVGLLGSAQQLEVFRNSLITITVPDGDLYVVDRKGQFVFHRTRTGPEHLGDYARTPVVTRLLRGEQGIAELENTAEREVRLAAYRQLPSLGWGLVVYRAKDRILQTAHLAALAAGGVGLVLAVTIVGLSAVAFRSRRRTLEALDALEAKTVALEETQEELVRKERLAILGQLAGGVAHELRNPLGVIKNSVYYLRMILPHEERSVKHLGLLDREVATANRIVTDLLDFARVRPPIRVPTDLGALARDVLEQTPLPDNIAVELRRTGAEPPVAVDPEQIVQVLRNLVSNAAQAMPDGGTLTVETAVSDGRAQIAVTDTGVGIPREQIEKIFQPLFTTKAKGIGLGLAVVKSLAEANGGAVTVESEPGRGSRFALGFPL